MAHTTYPWTVLTDQQWHLVRVAGELDIATSRELDTVLAGALSHHAPADHLVLDVGGITFLDCSGLRPLIRTRRSLGNHFWLAQVPAPVNRLLELTDLTTAFPVLVGPIPLQDDDAPSAEAATGGPAATRRTTPLEPLGPRPTSPGTS